MDIECNFSERYQPDPALFLFLKHLSNDNMFAMKTFVFDHYNV